MPGQADPTGTRRSISTVQFSEPSPAPSAIDVTLGGIAGAVYSACLLCWPTMNSVASMIFTSSHSDRFWT